MKNSTLFGWYIVYTKMNKKRNQHMKYVALFCSFQLCWGCKNETALLCSTGKHASVVFRWSPSGAGPICSCSPAACHRALNLKHSALSQKTRATGYSKHVTAKADTEGNSKHLNYLKKNTALLSPFAYASLLNVQQHTFHGVFLANELHLLSCWSVKPRQGSSASKGPGLAEQADLG